MLKRIIVLMTIMIALFGCAKKSSEWTEQHVLQLAAAIPTVGNPLDLDTDDERVYVAEDQAGISIIDLNDYSKTWLTAIATGDTTTMQLRRIRRASHINSLDLLFLSETYGSDNIIVINTANPDSLVLSAQITGGTSDIRDMKFFAPGAGSNYVYEGIFITGQYIKHGYSSYVIPGLPPIFSPVTIDAAATSFPINPIGAVMSDTHIYVAADQLGLVIYNRATGNPVGKVDLPGYAQKVKVVGNYAYLACRHEGMQIVNVANPAAPVRVSGIDTSGYATNIDVWNNYAVVSSGGGGIYLFDITNPANPVLKDNITSCGYANNVKFHEGKVLVASRDLGLLVSQRQHSPSLRVLVASRDLGLLVYNILP